MPGGGREADPLLPTATARGDVMAGTESDGARAPGVGGAMLALSISLGHRTGLYDTLAELEPATSAQIAERAGVQERYVREWLAGQLAGGNVEDEPRAQTLWLPREHPA